MWSRRHFLLTGGVGVLGGAALALDDEPRDRFPDRIPDGSQAKGMVTPEAELAIAHGLEFLRTHQLNDGSFGTNAYRSNVAVTSLAALAFMAGGSLPGRGPYGKMVLDALKFILLQEDANIRGYLRNVGDRTHGPMYGHGFGTLFLGEIAGMTRDPALRDKVRAQLKRSVDLIVRCQSRDGGWRYRPDTTDADISVTICQIMALRSARNAGISVPKDTVDKCVNYVKSCQDRREGWFRYRKQESGGDHQSFARTAAGLAALYSAGIYKGPEVELALNYLMTRCMPNGNFPQRPDMYYFYGHYYAAQAMWTAGGQYWSEWFPAIRRELLQGVQNRRDGSWLDICTHYGTAMACIILQIPNNYLPIMQK